MEMEGRATQNQGHHRGLHWDERRHVIHTCPTFMRKTQGMTELQRQANCPSKCKLCEGKKFKIKVSDIISFQ